MDQLSAHLDRGWDLAQRGDTKGAQASARKAIELSPDSPEAHNLLGFVAALDGDCDEAIEAYQHAILLDDTYVEAMLNAAELLLHPMGNHDEALLLCDQILEVSDYDDEILDAKLLKFEALLAKGDTDEARRVLKTLRGPFESPNQQFLVGRAFFELGELALAREHIDAALAGEPRQAEAHYFSALLHEEHGNRRAARQSFLMARQLELELGMPPWAPNAETFLHFTEKAILDLSPRMRRFVQQAELYVTDLPGTEVIVDGVDPRALVLIDTLAGAPLPGDAAEATEVEVEVEAGAGPGAATPLRGEQRAVDASVRVFLYALNVLKAAGNLHGVQAQIHQALEQEIEAVLLENEPPPSSD